MKVLDLSTISTPNEIGRYDTAGEAPRAEAVATQDSFAYLATRFPGTVFRVIDVSSPENPRLAAWRPTGIGRACIVRDTLAYLAEDGQLEIFSIANPRNPRLVGSCATSHAGTTLWLTDTLAFANQCIFNIKNPANPFIVGTFGVWPLGNCVRDTFAYLAINFGGLQVWSVADPTAPRFIDSVPYVRGFDVVVADSLLYVGGLDLRVLKLDDPTHPTEIGHYQTPYRVRRLFYSAPYIYAACSGAGVCILETASTTGIADPVSPGREIGPTEVMPNPTSGIVTLRKEVTKGPKYGIELYNAAGRIVLKIPACVTQGKSLILQQIDISSLPDGCYFLRVEPSAEGETQKVIKTTRR